MARLFDMTDDSGTDPGPIGAGAAAVHHRRPGDGVINTVKDGLTTS